VGQGQKDEKICEERMEKRKNLTWSASMEEKLLELRLGVFQQNFLDAANRKDVQKGWELVRGKFIEAYPSLEQSVSVEKLKNKFQHQKSLYQKLVADDQKTGNRESRLEKPGSSINADNWEILNMYFAGRDGLSNINLGEGGQLHQNLEFTTMSAPSPAESSATANEFTSSPSEKRAQPRKKQKVDLGQSMQEMGLTLANAMKDAFNGPENSQMESTLKKVSETLISIQEQQKQQGLAIQKQQEEQSAINSSILKQLQSLSNKRGSE
jgi:selenocysteine-specific translation elongation factor